MLMRSVMSSTSTMFYQLQKVFYFKSRVLSLIKWTQSVKSLSSFTQSNSTKTKLAASYAVKMSNLLLEKFMSAQIITIKVKRDSS